MAAVFSAVRSDVLSVEFLDKTVRCRVVGVPLAFEGDESALHTCTYTRKIYKHGGPKQEQATR